MALGLVRAAQGRDADAEKLMRDAIDIVAEVDYRYIERECIAALASYLRSKGRDDEAQPFEERLLELSVPGGSAPSII